MFFITVRLSACATRALVFHLSDRDEDGHLLLPSPFAVVLLFFAMLALHSSLAFMFYVGVLRLCGRRGGDRDNAEVEGNNTPSNRPSNSWNGFTAMLPTAPSLPAPSAPLVSRPYVYNGLFVRSPPEGYVALRTEAPQPNGDRHASGAQQQHVTAPVMAQFSSPVAII